MRRWVRASVSIKPDWDLAAQAAPDYEVDQRVNCERPKRQFRCTAGEPTCGVPGAPAIPLLDRTPGGETDGGSENRGFSRWSMADSGCDTRR